MTFARAWCVVAVIVVLVCGALGAVVEVGHGAL